MGEINIGQYAFPFVLTAILAFLYKQFELPGGGSSLSAVWKTRLAVITGVFVALGAMFYLGIEPTYKNLVDYILYGFINGGAAIGLWELVSRQKEK